MVATPRVVAPQSLSVKFSSSAFTTQPKVSFHGRTTSFLVKNNIPSSVMFVVHHSSKLKNLILKIQVVVSQFHDFNLEFLEFDVF